LRKAEISKEEFEAEAEKFVRDTGDEKTSVKSREEAIGGAMDIIAEEVSDHANLREEIKVHEELNAILETKPTKTFEENGVYKIYGDYKKSLKEIPSYAYLAMFRAEKEKQISVDFQMARPRILEKAWKYFIPGGNPKERKEVQ
jgi:uncharacterized protein